MRRVLAAVLAAVALAITKPAAAQELAQDPVQPIIDRALALEAEGKAEEAIQILKDLLAANPSNAEARFRLARFCVDDGDVACCEENAALASKLRSDFQAESFLLLGDCRDSRGAPFEALDAYRGGMTLFPGDESLTARLVSSHEKLGQIDEARGVAERAVLLDSGRASFHLLLARVMQEQGDRVGAILAYVRGLSGGDVAGAKEAMPALVGLLGKRGGGSTAPQADLRAAEEAMDGASRPPAKGKTLDARRATARLEALVAALAATPVERRGKSIVWTTYLPWFADLRERGLLEPLCYRILHAGGVAGARAWVEKHGKEMGALDGEAGQ